MIGRLLVPALAIAGLATAVYAISTGNRVPPIVTPVVPMVASPFASYVAGVGIVEARTENIAIGTAVPGIVTDVDVRWGDRVASGDRLFKIDDRDLQGQLLVADAKVGEAHAALAKANNLLVVGEHLTEGRSIAGLELANRRFDAGVAEAALASAKAQVEQLRIEVGRRSIRAPLAGRVLQIKIHAGEFAQSGVVNPPLMLLGDDTRLHVRAEINEADAWRFRPAAAAIAFVPGNPNLNVPLRFVRTEPYVIPKVSLTGESTERTDTRVLQVIYSFERAESPIYIGQRMDVYVEAPPEGSLKPGARPALH